MSELTQNIKKIKAFNQRAGDYLAGCEHGKTMAEVDAYYEGLLQEIKVLQESLKRIRGGARLYQKMEMNNGQKEGKEINPGG